MRLDDRNEPQPGEAERPEAPVIRAWPAEISQCWRYTAHFAEPCRASEYTAVELIAQLRAIFPGHTIDLSAEPPEGISR